jgi:uncharacterized membrane-anchored protein YjiN (DUF445 family)
MNPNTASITEANRDKAAGLRRMKVVAGALLGFVTLGFVLTSVFEDRFTWLGYVRAGFEAAMVGAIADWFAVTALFRHPFGIPIPHTAIVAKRKNEIGRGLGEFVESNFLTAEVLGPKIVAIEPVQRVAKWVIRPANTEAVRVRICEGLLRIVDSLDDAEIANLFEGRIHALVGKYPPAPTASKILRNIGASGRREQFLDSLLKRAHDALWDNQEALAHQFISESPWWVPNSVDQRMFDRLFGGITATLGAMRSDHQHELRQALDRKIDRFLIELESSPAMAAKAELLVNQLLERSTVRRLVHSFWQDTKIQLTIDLSSRDSFIATRISRAVNDAAAGVLSDSVRATRYNQTLERVIVTAVGSYGHELSALISSTVERWDTNETVTRIEDQIGRDLQFIRINGTLVGGVVGVLLFSFGKLL